MPLILMQTSESLLPNDLLKIKPMPGLISLISSFTVGDQLNYKYRDAGEQQDVNKAASMKDKLQDKPNQQKTQTCYPHFRCSISNCPWVEGGCCW